MDQKKFKIEDAIKEVTVRLNSNPEATVTARKSITAKELAIINSKKKDGDDNFVLSLRMLELMITSWDFVGDDDKMLPITIENIEKLSITDITKIIKDTGAESGFLAEKTKN